ncbi:MAG: zinc-ribbon domain-containing protein [Clostridia bacterium]
MPERAKNTQEEVTDIPKKQETVDFTKYSTKNEVSVCKKCGFQAPSTAKFCPKCGNSL